MKTILALETSTDLASVALLHQENITSIELSGVNTHSHGLLPAIQSLLVERGLKAEQLDLIAFDCGPGAFTGVRTACGVVQGISFACDIPVLSVNSLHVQAQAAREENGFEECLCVLDARMAEVYWAQLQWAGREWLERTPSTLGKLDAIEMHLDHSDVPVVIGSAVELSSALKSREHLTHAMPHAKYVLSLAAAADPVHFVQAQDAQPLYLRNKVALTTAERLSGQVR